MARREVHQIGLPKANVYWTLPAGDSFTPTQQKVALVKSLTSRAMTICSESRLPQELDKLQNVFLDNGYPSLVIEKAIKSVAEQKVIQGARDNGREIKAFLRLPRIENISYGFRKKC